MSSYPPLAERVRPNNLNDYAGQSHLVGEGAVLRRMVESQKLSSMILWGPPGVGKTTLARILANQVNALFFNLSAINSGVKDVREVLEKCRSRGVFNPATPILFIDEIHRFSKSQQDSLLDAVEKGVVTLIGATTENPSFEIITPLLSRCQVYLLEPLSNDELMNLWIKAKESDVLLKSLNFRFEEEEALFRFSGGDARKFLNTIELVISTSAAGETVIINNEAVTNSIQRNLTKYDKDGELHYDIISAFIKSIRGSDPDGALYWLARMVEGGEDPKFIARRLIISAAEDIGLANPNALLLATSCFEAIQIIGWPESRIILSEATIYLATSAKSNSAYLAINKAQELVRQHGDLPVPLHLRNAPTKLMKEFGYGANYKYSHDYKGNFAEQDYLPGEIKEKRIWLAQDNPQEARLKERMNELWPEKYK